MTMAAAAASQAAITIATVATEWSEIRSSLRSREEEEGEELEVEGQRTRYDGAAEAAKAALPETGPFTSQPTPAQLSQIAQVAPPTMFGHGAGFRQGGGSAEQPAPVTLAPPPPPEPSPAELLLLRRAVAVRIFRERRSVAARRAVERSQSLRRFWVRNDVAIGGDGTAAGGGGSEQVSSAQPLSRWAVDQFRLTFSLAGGGSMLARQRLSSLAMLCSTLEGAAARECQTVLGWASRPESRRLPRLTDASLSRSSFDGVALRSLQSALLELTSLPGAGTGSSKGEPECGGLEVFAELEEERREEKRNRTDHKLTHHHDQQKNKTKQIGARRRNKILSAAGRSRREILSVARALIATSVRIGTGEALVACAAGLLRLQQAMRSSSSSSSSSSSVKIEVEDDGEEEEEEEEEQEQEEEEEESEDAATTSARFLAQMAARVPFTRDLLSCEASALGWHGAGEEEMVPGALPALLSRCFGGKKGNSRSEEEGEKAENVKGDGETDSDKKDEKSEEEKERKALARAMFRAQRSITRALPPFVSLGAGSISQSPVAIVETATAQVSSITTAAAAAAAATTTTTTTTTPFSGGAGYDAESPLQEQQASLGAAAIGAFFFFFFFFDECSVKGSKLTRNATIRKTTSYTLNTTTQRWMQSLSTSSSTTVAACSSSPSRAPQTAARSSPGRPDR